MTDQHTNIDTLLRRALACPEPDPTLLRRVKASLRKEQDMKTGRNTKRIVTLALAAALLLALSVTAYAVVDAGEWFKYYFSLGGELTEGQQEYIGEAAVGIGQSVTADGWTVTLASGMTDGRQVILKLVIQSEDKTRTGTFGQDLAPILYGSLASTDPDAPVDTLAGGEASSVGDDGGVWTQVMRLDVPTGPREQKIDFSYPLALTLDRLESRPRGQGDLLSEGPWDFQFTLTPAPRRELELVTEPFTATGIIETGAIGGVPEDEMVLESSNGYTVEEEEVDVTVVSLKLSELGAALAYRYEGETVPHVYGWDLDVELAGGRRVGVSGGSSGWDEALQAQVAEAFFTVPIDLDEVTAVSFQGHELTMPE